MPYRVLMPIKHGQGSRMFQLEPGAVVSDDFFDEQTVATLLRHKAIEKTGKAAEKQPTGEQMEQLPDIKSMSVTAAKELLNEEIDLVNLHKFLDAEKADGHPRKSIVNFIEMKIKELTGG